MWPLLPLPHVATVFLVLQAPVGKYFIHTVCSHNSSKQDFKGLPMLFGLAGHLGEARPENICHPIQGPPNNSSVFIALVRRYNRCSATKVFHARQVGYQDAIMYNVNSTGFLSMVGNADAKQKIHISSMLTTEVDSGICSGKLTSVVLFSGHLHLGSGGASKAVRRTTSACKCHIRLPGPCLQIATLHIFWMIPVSTVIASLLVEKYLSMSKKWRTIGNQPYREKGNEQAGFLLLSSKYQECAICLEKYLEYDSLKVLSCSHAFHSRCIDRWHITQTRSKTCPLCMQKVILVVRLHTVRLWKEEARGQGKGRKFWPGKAKPSFDQ